MATEEAQTQTPSEGVSEKAAQSEPGPVELNDMDRYSHHPQARWRTVYNRLGYVPPRVRYDPDKPFQFSMGLNILFGVYHISTNVTTANSSSSFCRMLHRREPLLQPPNLKQASSRL